MVTDEQMRAISEFYAATDRLKQLNIIRSDRYLGDIAEFIAKSLLGMDMAKSCREQGHDGYIGSKKVEVKYNGGKSITVNAGDPNTYDELILILGPNSAMRDSNLHEDYVIYRIPSSEVSKKRPHADGAIRLAKGNLCEKHRVKY